MKVRFHRWYNTILSILLTLLGFEACSSDDDRDDMPMYGVPMATYHLKGQVTDESGKPIEGIKTAVKYVYKGVSGKTETWGIDSVMTDANGQYMVTTFDIHQDTKLIVEDVDGEANGGKYRSDTLSIDRSRAIKTADGKGTWDEGTFDIHIDNIKMKKDEADTPDA